MEQVLLQVDGMNCQACVKNVTKVLSSLSGVTKAEVSLEDKQAVVDYDVTQVQVAQMIAAVEDAGFDCR